MARSFGRFLVAWIVASPFLVPTARAQVATLVRASGQVEILVDLNEPTAKDSTKVRFDGREYRLLKTKVGLRLKDGAIIKTGNESKATMIYQNGDMISLGADTYYRVLPVKAKEKTTFEVVFGKVRAQISKDGPRKDSEILTRTALMGVRGTDFYVKGAGPGGTSELIVLRGEVAVTPKGSTAAPIAVKSGDTVAVKPDAAKPDGPPPVVERADKATLVVVQKETTVAPASKESGGDANVVELEKKAAANILKDIKVADPVLYQQLEKTPADQRTSTYALNTAVVEQVFEKAPVVETRPLPADVAAVFVKVVPIDQPVLVQPPPATTLTTGEPERKVDFVWKVVKDAAKYEWQIADDVKFSGKVISGEATGNTTSVSLAPAEYVWRVRAVDAKGREGLWSETRRLSLGRVLSAEEKLAEEKKKKEPQEISAEPPPPETPPPPPPVETPAEPVSRRGLFTVGIGGGSYKYTVVVDGKKTEHSGGGGGALLSLAYRVTERVELQASLGQRSYENFDDGAEIGIPLAELGARYWWHVLASIDLGSGLTVAREGLPHPSSKNAKGLETSTLEKLYTAFTVAPRAWPVTGWRAELGYGLIGGSTDVDVSDDQSFYALAGYERQWFSFPLTLGMVVRRVEHELTVREDGGLDDVQIDLGRTEFMVRAGYAF